MVCLFIVKASGFGLAINMVKCALTLWIIYPKQDVTLDVTLAKKYKRCILVYHCDITITVQGYISYSNTNTLCKSKNGEDVSYKITVNLGLGEAIFLLVRLN